MEELKCMECGALLEQGAAACPKCGCPVEAAAPVETEPAEKKKMNLNLSDLKIKVDVTAIIALVIGIVISVMGNGVMNQSVNMLTYSAGRYSVDYCAFGADFYTEIYNASDVMVDAMSGVGNGVAAISNQLPELASAIYYCAGMLMIAIGLSTVAGALPRLLKQD